MSIAVRPATTADMKSLIRLNSLVQNVHVELEPSIFRSSLRAEDLERFWSDKFKSPDDVVVLANIDEAAVGYIWYEIQDRAANTFKFARRRIYVHHVAVDPVCQRSGVASVLFSYVESHAVRLGISNIALDVWSANEPAQAFYRRVGLSPINIVMSKFIILQ